MYYKFPFISLAFPALVSHKFPGWEYFWNCFLSFSPFFPEVGEIDFPFREFCFHIDKTQLPNFVPNFPPNFHWILPEFPRFPNDAYWFPLIPQFLVQFSIQLHKCRPTLSLSTRSILCILHVSLKMRILHYVRQRFINLGNSGENQENSEQFWGNQTKSFSFVFTRFPRCEIHFHLGEI